MTIGSIRIVLLTLFAAGMLWIGSATQVDAQRKGGAPATEEKIYHRVSTFPYRLAEKLDEATILKSTEPDLSATKNEVRWDFDEAPDQPDWEAHSGLSELAYSEGVLRTVVTEDQALLLAPIRWEMPPASIGQVSFRIKLSQPRTIGLWWGDEVGPPKLKGQLQFQVPRAGEFFEIKSELTSSRGWDSGVKWSAITFTNCKGVEVELDWFAFATPLAGEFVDSLGLTNIRLGDESRNVLYTFSPSTIEFNLILEEPTILDLGIGVAPPAKMGAIFDVQIQSGADTRTLVAVTHMDTRTWRDFTRIDLSEYTSKKISLRLRNNTQAAGTVALWSNPMLFPAQPKTDRTTVVVYLVDTLRTDSLGVYGNPHSTSPFIDSFAARGILFERCFTPASWTLPSVTSLFTSTSPPRHAVTSFKQGLADSFVTAAEVLRENGYITASFITNEIAGRISNLQQGFDFLVELKGTTPGNWADAAALNLAVFPWLDRFAGQPIAIYVHATDPHSPYSPPKTYENLFLPNPQGRVIRVSDELQKTTSITEQEIQNVRSIYEAEVRFTDDQFHLLCEKLERMGATGNTLVVFTADHGEGFNEHKLFGHGNSLYNEVTAVPLIISGPSSLPKGIRVPDLVQLTDVYPTVFAILGIPVPDQFQGGNLLQYANPGHSAMRQRVGYFASGYAEGFWTAKIDFPWKLLQDAYTREFKLFNIEEDPGEKIDLTAQYPERAQSMRATVEEWLESQLAARPTEEAPEVVIDEATMERLRALGYVK